jgi:hypothetical protein
VNFVANETVANLVTVPLSAAGAIDVANFAGTTLVDVDVEGFYSAAGAGLYNPMSPVRVSLTDGTPIGASATADFPVTGTGDSVPASATAVVVNLTASGGTAASYLSAYATGATAATTSSLNFTAGETVANRDIVNVGTGGKIEVFNLAGSVNVDVDVDGYYAGTGGQFVPLAAPVRVTDTRTSTNGTTMTSGGTEAFNLATTASGIPSTASAVAANFTVVPGEAPGYITVYPTGVTTPPTASDVNWPASSGPVANFTQADTAGTTAGSAEVYNLDSGSPVDVVIDDFGYFTGITSGVVVSNSSPTITTSGSATTLINAVVTNTGLPVNADTLSVTHVGSPTAACGALSAGPYTTNSSGTLGTAITYTGSTTVGTCTITITEADHGLSGSTVVTQAANNTLAIATTAGPIGSTGAPHTTAESTTSYSPQVVNFWVANPVGTGVVGDVINFSLTPDTTGGCGSFSGTTATTATATSVTGGTAAAGNVAITYDTPFNTGMCTITATEATAQTGESAPQSGITVIDSTTSAAPVVTALAITPLTASVASGATATVTATTTPVAAGDTVYFTPTAGTAACGSLSSPTATTNASGVATVTYTAGSAAGTCSITAAETRDGIAATAPEVITTTVNTNNSVAVSASPSSVINSGTATSTVTATVTSSGGAPVASDIVSFSLAGTPSAACGTLSATGGATNSSGVVTDTYTSSTTAGFCTVTATEGGTSQTGTVQITQNV